MRPQVVVAGLALMAALPLAARAATISSVSPNRGSMLGGTRLTILGEGFASEFEYTLAVYVGTQLCRVEDYYTTNTQIVCYAPPTGASERARRGEAENRRARWSPSTAARAGSLRARGPRRPCGERR